MSEPTVTESTESASSPRTQKASAPRKPSHEKKPPSPPKKLGQVLPTERITFKRQLDLIRGYAAASAGGTKAVSNREVAAFVGMTENTVAMANPFLVQAGFFQRVPGGLMPAPEVLAFHNAHEWDPDGASTKLAPILSRTWFSETLLPRLSMGPMDEERAIMVVAEAATADPKYKPNLKLVLDYLQAAGLIQRENGQVRLIRTAEIASGNGHQGQQASAAPEPAQTSHAGALATTFSGPAAGGAVQFQVAVKVDMAEFKGWSQERIAAFFAGIAQVLAAKGALEKQASEG